MRKIFFSKNDEQNANFDIPIGHEFRDDEDGCYNGKIINAFSKYLIINIRKKHMLAYKPIYMYRRNNIYFQHSDAMQIYMSNLGTSLHF